MKRRTFLRGALGGAVASIALPPLEAMFNTNGTAHADGTPIPTRMGVWFWGNGIRRSQWMPSGEGFGWQPASEMAPLQRVRDYVSPVTGLEIKTASHPHHSGMTGIMTGARYAQVGTTRDTIVTTFARQSVDQVAADLFAAQGVRTPYRSLEVAIADFRGTDEGTTFQHLSHNGPNAPNPSEYAPARFFDRLFGAGPLEPQLAASRRSVLDIVNGQIRRLQGRVGANDRRRLEQHFESIRAIEQRLGSDATACRVPPRPGEFPAIDGREQLTEKNTAMSQLMALALACDLTRSFSVMFSSAGSGVVVWPAGAPNSMHQMCHDEAGDQPIVHQSVVYIMERLGDFLQTLRDQSEGDANVLHNCSILCTTELSEGNRHSNDEFPVLIAGKGGGRLKGGFHFRSDRGNASYAAMTALHGAGLAAPEFGAAEGLVREPIGALFA
jgi:hypothetical protein